MRVCWVVQTPSSKIARKLGRQEVVFGGWTGTMIDALSEVEGIKLAVIMKAAVEKPERHEAGGVMHYLVRPTGRGGFDIDEANLLWAFREFQPDLVHVEGSEFAHALTVRNAWSGKLLLSMQGVINAYRTFEYGQISLAELCASGDPRKMLFALSLVANKVKNFIPRLAAEREVIARADALSGRTLWDRAQARAYNPSAPYYHVARILRSPFYEVFPEREFERFTLFAGNAGSPRKGAHFAIKALALLKRDYPTVKLRIAGTSPYSGDGRKAKNAFGYFYYLRDLVKRLQLQDNVEFTGELPAGQMADMIRRSHVFLLSSLIENSPNTLAEAMMLGTPVVSAFCGGAPDMARDGEEALFYRPSDAAMLAEQVRRLFEDDKLAARLSRNARARAIVAHDRGANRDRLVAAYREILAGE